MTSPVDTPRSPRRARRAVATLLLGTALLAAGCAGRDGPPALTPPGSDTRSGGEKVLDLSAFTDRVGKAPMRSTVAHALGRRVDVYERPGAASPARAFDNPTRGGSELVLLVAEQEDGWLKVLLPVRPNGSAGWIRESQVRLTQHDYHVVVALAAHTVTVYDDGQVIHREPVGIGREQTPTPGGLYYTTELIRPPNPRGVYGPYAYGLSGFSEVLETFNGGEPFLGLHGTNDPSGLGKDVSHGCIRMSNKGITKLRKRLPPAGVPVIVVP